MFILQIPAVTNTGRPIPGGHNPESNLDNPALDDVAGDTVCRTGQAMAVERRQVTRAIAPGAGGNVARVMNSINAITDGTWTTLTAEALRRPEIQNGIQAIIRSRRERGWRY